MIDRWFVLLTLLARLAHVRQESASARSEAVCVEACCETKLACDAGAAGITLCSNPL